jgi:hypothetical protein
MISNDNIYDYIDLSNDFNILSLLKSVYKYIYNKIKL